MFYKLILALIIVFGYISFGYMVYSETSKTSTIEHLSQLDSPDVGPLRQKLDTDHYYRVSAYFYGWIIVFIVLVSLFLKDVLNMWKSIAGLFLVLVCLSSTGCWRPFEPVQLEVIQSTEEAFLLPYTQSADKQSSSHTEEFLRKNLVYTQQVKIPQQWVQKGYETMGPNGEWRPAAILIKVDKSPVTREWTADPNSGTSNRNEAIWVMTSDQVEFSTGWTCTARIASRDDAVKFLYNYPNGSLEKVMDGEIRARLQTSFGLEVTDLPMSELRLKATPHIINVITSVKEFFLERGITITNLGITGGFVYKDPTIIKTMVEVFNAEQKKSIAIADTTAQSETNKKIQLEADAKAKATLTIQQAEADGIKLVADAKNYEIEKANKNLETYITLKRIEIEKEKLEKWDGRFPNYFMGGVEGLNLLLQTPPVK
jgi:hypothetical protein